MSWGIFVRSTGAVKIADTVIDGVTLRDIDTTHNAHGITFSHQAA